MISLSKLMAVVMALCFGVERAVAQEGPRLRVLTYNIHHGEGTDGKLDLARIARVVVDQRPDLVALQEVDAKTRRTGGVDQAAELARLTGMHVVFGKAIDFQGGGYGNAVLSRFPITSSDVHPLPAKEGVEKRSALAVVVKPWERGPEVTFVCTHLDHLRNDEDRLAQAAEIRRVLAGKKVDAAVVLAGDLNAVPESETIKRFGEWKDAAADGGGPTVPAANPTRRIDYVLVRPPAAWRTIETSVIEEPVASDHRPVLAVAEWRGESAIEK